jgi:antitoxin (DNA-binding transcriptional repressor) of toxin-antitoxin stability system
MLKVTIHVAKTQLSRLIEAALTGEDVVIAKGDKPVVRLVPIPQGQCMFGVLEPGALGEGPDFFSPMEEEELAAWEGCPDDAPPRHACGHCRQPMIGVFRIAREPK